MSKTEGQWSNNSLYIKGKMQKLPKNIVAKQQQRISLIIPYFSREVTELVISIIQARDLTPFQYSGTIDTYIRGIVLPDSDCKFQTKVSITQLFSDYSNFLFWNFKSLLNTIFLVYVTIEYCRMLSFVYIFLTLPSSLFHCDKIEVPP